MTKRQITLIAIYYVCAGYHSGQWSRGYRLLCKIGRYLEKHYSLTHPLNSCFRVDEQNAINDTMLKLQENKNLMDSL